MLSNILFNFMHLYKITGHKSWHHILGFLTSTLTLADVLSTYFHQFYAPDYEIPFGG